MSPDERAIRDVVATWSKASAAGDVDAVLALMTDDVVFLVAGQPPFGKEAFAKASRAMSGVRMEGKSDIEELNVIGDHAYARTRLTVTATSPDGKSVHRAGYTLSIFRKENGSWKLARDANLLTTVPA